MLFCLDNTQSALEFCVHLAQSFEMPDSTIDEQLAKIYVVSDILHNSTLPSHPYFW